MYLRWKRQRITGGWFKGGIRYQAVLVECHRVDGKPTQQYIKCLGSRSQNRWMASRLVHSVPPI